MEARSKEFELMMKAQEGEMKLRHQAMKNDLDAKALEHKQRMFMVESAVNMQTKEAETNQNLRLNEATNSQKLRHQEEQNKSKLAANNSRNGSNTQARSSSSKPSRPTGKKSKTT